MYKTALMAVLCVAALVPEMVVAQSATGLFANAAGGFNMADLLDPTKLAAQLFSNNAPSNPLSAIFSGGGGQSDLGADDCLGATFGAASGAAGSSPLGGITKMIGGSQLDFCKNREQPQSKKQVSWTDLQEFLANPQAAINEKAKEACLKQVEDEQARCERQKKVLCSVLSPSASPTTMFAAFKDNICEEEKQKQAADACNQVTGMILGGRGLSTQQVTNAVTNTAKKGATTSVLCDADLENTDPAELLNPQKASQAIKAAQAAQTANQLLGGAGGNAGSALGGGNLAGGLTNIGSSGIGSGLANGASSGIGNGIPNLGSSSGLANIGRGASALGLPSIGRMRRHVK